MKRIFLGILIFFLASCSGSNEQLPTNTPVTQTSSPTQTSTTITVIPNDESEGSSIKDIIPTPKLSATPTPLSSHYDLPAWARNPETTIAAALITNDTEKTRIIALFNAATGEKYEISIPITISGYFWYDNQNLGFLANDLKTVYSLNLASGNIFLKELSQYSTRLLEPDWNNGLLNGLRIVAETELNQDLTLTAAWQPNTSKAGTYTAIKKSNWDGITVTNNITNETVLDFTAPAETYITVFAWSSVNDDLLAYVQGKLAYPTDLIIQDMTLNLIDVSSGKLLKTYSGDFGRMTWSPDGDKILYENARAVFSNYGVAFTEAPCIMFLNLDEQRCLRSIPRNVPDGYVLATTAGYNWSMDGKKVFYTALYYKNQENYSIRSNVCIYDLIDGHINCPTENLDALDERDVGYSISPNDEYLYLCISKSTSLNDYADESNDGIMKVDGSGFFTWQGTVRGGMPSEICSYDVLWKPLP